MPLQGDISEGIRIVSILLDAPTLRWNQFRDPRFMEGREFDFARSEDKDSISKENVERLAEIYLAKVRGSGAGVSGIEAIEHYFKSISDSIRRVERARLAAESSHIEPYRGIAKVC